MAVVSLRKPPAVRAKRKPRELGPHKAILQWLRYALPRGWKVHHSPNQGTGRNARQGAVLKAMGVLAGFPDIIILGPAELVPSVFFVEVKAPGKAKASVTQADLHDELIHLGYKVGIATSIDEMRTIACLWQLPIRDYAPFTPVGAAAEEVVVKLARKRGGKR